MQGHKDYMQKNNLSGLFSTRRGLMAAVLVLCLNAVPAMAQISAFEDPMGSAGPGGNELAPKKDEFDGGEIGQGQTAQIVTLFRNNSGTPLTIGKIDMVPSANVAAVMGNNQCSLEPLKPGVECAITVSVTGQSNGKFRVGMLINHNGKSRLTNAAIVGTVSSGGGSRDTLQGEIEAFPADLDFGSVTSTAPLVRSLALRNSTGMTINIQNIDLAASPTSGFAISVPKCRTLKPGQACVATVTWTPTVTGKVEGVIVLQHDAPSGAMRIGLKGDYSPKKVEIASRFANAVPGEGLLVADQEKVDFGSSVDGAASISLTLVNQGDKELMIKQIKLAGSDNGLSVSSSDCRKDKVLQSGEACVLTVNWQPRRIGPVIDDIQIIHTGTRRVLVLPVRGTALQPVSNSSSSSISYGDRIPDMPKIDTGKLDENLIKDPAAKPAKTTSETRSNALSAGDTAATLDGYRISSIGGQHAVLAGPKGRLIIKDSEAEVVDGVRWVPHIVPEGVEFTSGKNVVLLVFDKSLAVMQSVAPTSGTVGTYGLSTGTITNVNTLSGAAATTVGGTGAVGGTGVGGAVGGVTGAVVR